MQADGPLEAEAQDRLDRRQFAVAVADAIAGRSDRSSIVIGIYGPWGDGKTTVLNWVRTRLERPGVGMVVVPFNPWLIRDELSLLPTFFTTLAAALGRSMGGKSKRLAHLLERYGSVVSGVTLGVPGVSFDPGRTASEIGKAMADRTPEELKAELETILREEGKRVLVIVDDVDRLDDAEIQMVFKLVKLVAALEGISYLLAFDDERVAAALAQRYSAGAIDGPDHEGGFDFLEKIVQVPLRLPKARRKALDHVTLEGLQAALNDAGIEVTDEDAREFRLRYSEGLAPAISSVRTAKRYANAAGFALPLLKGEAHPVDVLTVEGINACYPALYGAIRNHPNWFLLPYEFHLSNREEEVRQRHRDRLEQALEVVDPGLRDAARSLLQRLFPQIEGLWTNFGSVHERDDWAEQRRVCSVEYFDRYFSYGVGEAEIGDGELDDVLEDTDAIAEHLSALVDRKGDAAIEPLLVKLSRRASNLDDNRKLALVDALVGIGPRVARDRTRRFLELNVAERTAHNIAELVTELPASLRLDVSVRIIDRAEPLLFAAECLRWLHAKKSHTDDRRPLEKNQWDHVAARLGTRIASHAEKLGHPLWLDDGGARLMFQAGHAGEAARMRKHVSTWLIRDPALVQQLLGAAAGVAYGGTLGLPSQQDLTADVYNALARITDLRDVRAAVRSLRGKVQAPTDFPTLRYGAEDVDSALLDQFAWQDGRATAAAYPPAERLSTAGLDGTQDAHGRAARRTGRSAVSVTLHSEIAAVLEEAGEPLVAGEIAERVRTRGRFSPPRRQSPVDARQIRARVARPEYRDMFSRRNGKIGLRRWNNP